MPIHSAQHRAGTGQFDAVSNARRQQQPWLQPRHPSSSRQRAVIPPENFLDAYNLAPAHVRESQSMPVLSGKSIVGLALLSLYCSQASALPMSGNMDVHPAVGALSGPICGRPVGRVLNGAAPLERIPNHSRVSRMNGIPGRVAAMTPNYRPLPNSPLNEAAQPSLVTKVAEYAQDIGDSLINSGLVNLVTRHPTRAALTICGGLALVGAGTAALTYWQPWAPSADEALSVRDRFASICAPDGRTLDTKIGDAIHRCGGDPQCARDAVSEILEPYGLNYSPPQDRPVARGVQAASMDPVAGWIDYVDMVVRAYEHWDEQSLLSDVEQIARSPSNEVRRDTIKSMLEDRGFTVQARRFEHPLPSWLNPAEENIFRGENLLVDVCGEPGVDPDKPVVMLVAHTDAIGEDSQGAADNASGCAVALALSERFRDNPPDRIAVRLLLVDGEEQGRLGSKKAVEQCHEAGDCAYLTINIDLAANGDHIYVSPSNASHLMAMEADDIDAARVPKSEPVSERQFIEAMQPVSQKAGLKMAAKTSLSDHLSYQFAGKPAVGLSLFRKDQVDALEQIANLSGATADAHSKIDWATLRPLRDELDSAFASGDSARKQTAMAAYTSAIKAQPNYGAYVAALNAQQKAVGESWVAQELHNANDTLAAIRPAFMVKFTDAVERSIRDFAVRLA
ncbi:MAG TPA: M28 family peptidase [Dyella sp.]|uniref:M28 family metallopeptidase n=1 Tax=Dyella sp. TaxID=1869338 RepID=UPI002F9559BB